jgi:hypothetical protein
MLTRLRRYVSSVINQLRVDFSSVEGAALLRTLRCMLAQGLIRGVLLFVAVSAAGYAGYKAFEFRCPKGEVCVKEPSRQKARH